MEQEWEGTSKTSFGDALQDAARKHGDKVGSGRVRVRLEADIEHRSPGHVTEYRVIITKK